MQAPLFDESYDDNKIDEEKLICTCELIGPSNSSVNLMGMV